MSHNTNPRRGRRAELGSSTTATGSAGIIWVRGPCAEATRPLAAPLGEQAIVDLDAAETQSGRVGPDAVGRERVRAHHEACSLPPLGQRLRRDGMDLEPMLRCAGRIVQL
ncbi:hypothetical protein [Enhygromyxa salina]|uniref:hypothetical protein n=1 Tax=Enhygromyxa salina TaxID=215803 RepID=UPI000D03BDD5|nr:hypothetical protein [Enhygromyxa salina]